MPLGERFSLSDNVRVLLLELETLTAKQTLTVVLWVEEGDRSRHSPNSIEAANITTVVTMATSRLSRTLK